MRKSTNNQTRTDTIPSRTTHDKANKNEPDGSLQENDHTFAVEGFGGQGCRAVYFTSYGQQIICLQKNGRLKCVGRGLNILTSILRYDCFSYVIDNKLPI